MKTTMTTRSTANPRRTTLAHAPETGKAGTAADRGPATTAPLPQHTANPRRTTLMVAPKH